MMDIITGRAPPPARAESHLSKGIDSQIKEADWYLHENGKKMEETSHPPKKTIFRESDLAIVGNTNSVKFDSASTEIEVRCRKMTARGGICAG